jgi:putative addiction module component (TIGR02574 family)
MAMNTLAELIEKALALPTEQRFALAQDLWASLDDKELPGWTEDELREELRQRLRDEPDDAWKTHQELMKQVRREFGWQGK